MKYENQADQEVSKGIKASFSQSELSDGTRVGGLAARNVTVTVEKSSVLTPYLLTNIDD